MEWFNLSDQVNLLSLIGAVAMILITFVVSGKYINQMKTDKSEGELAQDSWDEIKEYKNPIPVGWAVSFIVLIAWAIWYFLVGYPLNAYSQIGEYNEEVKAYNEKFEQKWLNPDHSTLMGMGESVYLVQCAPCHGVSGDGIGGKATDLTVWGSEAAIEDVINHGAKGMNYPLGEMMGGLVDKATAKAVAAYMYQEVSQIGKSKNPLLVETGRENWATCVACHGEDGKGMGGLAPDLTAYGHAAFAQEVLEKGKAGFIGVMPQFVDGRLSEIQKRAVGTYVLSLSK